MEHDWSLGKVGAMSEEIELTHRGGVAVIRINRPEKKNAVTFEMWEELLRHVRTIASSREVRAVVVTGVDGSFCAGADLGSAGGSMSGLEIMRAVEEVVMALYRLRKPTIAAVDGPAVGAGWNLALCCDLVLATERASFGQVFARRGLSVDFGGSWLLPRLVGSQRAKELMFSSRLLGAGDAMDLGVVSRVLDVDGFESSVFEYADELAHGPTLALGFTKELINTSFEHSLEESLRGETLAQSLTLKSKDAGEGARAFREKRDPEFVGY